MNLKSTILLFCLFIYLNNIFSQCFKENTTFQIGEKLSMEIYYNWGFVWVNAGYVYFKVDSANYKNSNCYKFTSYGRTYNNWDWFYKVRDLYTSYIYQEKLQTAFFSRKVFEGGNVIHNKYIFDYTKNKIYADLYCTDDGERKDTVDILSCLYDPLTAIYYARNIDFSNAEINQKFPIKIILDNAIFNIYKRYLGKEKITDRNNKDYSCIKFKAKMVKGTIFDGGEDLTVWVTDDKNKVPVLVKAKILVGSIKAYLSEADGLRY